MSTITGFSENEGNLDRFDRLILSVLSREGRIPVTELAKRVGLSKSPCQVRMRRLQDEGYIQGFRAILNPARLGLDHVAFVEVSLSDTTEQALTSFNAAVIKVPEIEQCHMIAGGFDYLMKVRTRNIATFRRVLGSTLSTLPYVRNTSTYVSMESVKDKSF